jgi:hypothetical protein
MFFICLCHAALAQPASNAKPSSTVSAVNPLKMTENQKKELLESVGRILTFVSNDTQFPIKHPVKSRLMSQEEVKDYLIEKFDQDEDASRLERSESVLKKMGLLNQTFHLRPFLLALLTEQIAGYYDNKTKTVNLLDWIQPEEQKPVLAHELTHALQDQRVGLTKWSNVSSSNTSRSFAEDNKRLLLDEADTARSAVAEGQAMAVFIDYSSSASGKPITSNADSGNNLVAPAEESSSPVLASAPVVMKDSLLFPYREGLSFEQFILNHSGKEDAFAGTLMRPPSSSFEILTPSAYLSFAPVPKLKIPNVHPLLKSRYLPYDIGVIGELDVRIMAETFKQEAIADTLSKAWNGGFYYAAYEKPREGDAAAPTTSSIALFYCSRWRTPEAAATFLHLYTTQIAIKYSNVHRLTQAEDNENEHIYLTSEGAVLLWNLGDMVFISEGFPLPLARNLRKATLAAQLHDKAQLSRNNEDELSLTFAHQIGELGMMKAALEQRYKLVVEDHTH